MDRLLAATLFCLLCTASTGTVAGASEPGGCVWGPIKDTRAGKVLLDTWAVSTGLDRFTRWGIGIDGSSGRVPLEFEHGALTLAWQLDGDCVPTVVSIEASRDYRGAIPDSEAVKQLVSDLRTVITEQRLGERSSPIYRQPSTLRRVLPALAVLALVAACIRFSCRAG